jgi:hypothetical protein
MKLAIRALSERIEIVLEEILPVARNSRAHVRQRG